jgi:hypothetical protein
MLTCSWERSQIAKDVAQPDQVEGSLRTLWQPIYRVKRYLVWGRNVKGTKRQGDETTWDETARGWKDQLPAGASCDCSLGNMIRMKCSRVSYIEICRQRAAGVSVLNGSLYIECHSTHSTGMCPLLYFLILQGMITKIANNQCCSRVHNLRVQVRVLHIQVRVRVQVPSKISGPNFSSPSPKYFESKSPSPSPKW